MSHTHKQHSCDHDHKHNHEQGHEHSHDHDHDHGKMPVFLFIAGVIAYLVALFINVAIIQNILFIVAMVSSGYHVIVEGFGDTYQQTRQKRSFSPNIHILMTLAALGASVIGNYEEGALLIIIFSGAHFLEEYAENRSKREITNLMNMNPTAARLVHDDGSIEMIDAAALKIGDTLQVLNGDQVPTDGVILSGYSSINESAISGESIPQEKTVGDSVFGSTINGKGSFTMKVTKNNEDTLFAKILQLVNQSQSNLSKTATKIKHLEPRYVTAVLILVPIFILAGPSLFNWSWYESFYRGMVFLTVASPCALAASAVPATLSAISNLAKRGVLFKGGSYLSNLNDIAVVAFDKTGTLTEGKPVVTDVYFIDDAVSQDYISIMAAMEKTANHPLADAIIKHFNETSSIELDVENIIGHGLVSRYQDDDYRIGKPGGFADVDSVIAQHNSQYAAEGKTVVYFAKNDTVVGLIAMMDIPNEKAKGVLRYLKSQGIQTVMITGDAKITGEAIGRQVGIDTVIGNVLPEDKAAIVKSLQEKHGIVAMLGDGVNDAPALVTADIGVAMGDGTDIAIDVADAVLMKNDLTKFSYAYQISKRLDKIIWQNIIFSMAVVVILVTMNIMGTMDLPFGVLVHEGSTLVVLFNGLRLLLPIKDEQLLNA